jgi:hypothetical protein
MKARSHLVPFSIPVATLSQCREASKSSFHYVVRSCGVKMPLFSNALLAGADRKEKQVFCGVLSASQGGQVGQLELL